MKTRTDEELNDIIRRWMGQEPATVVNHTTGQVTHPWPENAPDYCADLNAVHEAENKWCDQEGPDDMGHPRYKLSHQLYGDCVPSDRQPWRATARQRAEALVRVIEGCKCSQKHECQCGGIDHPHSIGEAGCFRYMTESPIPAGKHPELGCDTWKMPDEDGAITDFTLRQQRGYHQHECGCWSRSEGSFNSVEA